MSDDKKPKDEKEEESILEKLGNLVGKRSKKDDPQTRVGRGGKRRAKDIMDIVDRMQEGQSTDSNQ